MTCNVFGGTLNLTGLDLNSVAQCNELKAVYDYVLCMFDVYMLSVGVVEGE